MDTASSIRSRTLTQRQARVLYFLRLGYSNKRIACEIGSTESYVANICSDIFTRLGVENRTQAALSAAPD